MLSVVVLISGSGSNLRALLEACDNPMFPAKVLAVGADQPASGLAHAEEFDVPTFVVENKYFASRDDWANRISEHIEMLKPDLIVLAGFMKILPANFVNKYRGRLINLHPSLLPQFPGAHAVRDALSAGATKTGSTIHLVDEGVDTGRVLVQRELAIPPGISEAALHELIKEIEREQLVRTVYEIAAKEITLED
ncbi:MAG: phosphoribosylglycinamide formyltransferase [Actinobacteria bacterium]|jgi:phosphoribosylglycinamide formyltransferase-1|nr:phosphoribosylglycinamide formyltransferase [Actinomycetota bacterium]